MNSYKNHATGISGCQDLVTRKKSVGYTAGTERFTSVNELCGKPVGPASRSFCTRHYNKAVKLIAANKARRTA